MEVRPRTPTTRGSRRATPPQGRGGLQRDGAAARRLAFEMGGRAGASSRPSRRRCRGRRPRASRSTASPGPSRAATRSSRSPTRRASWPRPRPRGEAVAAAAAAPERAAARGEARRRAAAQGGPEARRVGPAGRGCAPRATRARGAADAPTRHGRGGRGAADGAEGGGGRSAALTGRALLELAAPLAPSKEPPCAARCPRARPAPSVLAPAAGQGDAETLGQWIAEEPTTRPRRPSTSASNDAAPGGGGRPPRARASSPRGRRGRSGRAAARRCTARGGAAAETAQLLHKGARAKDAEGRRPPGQGPDRGRRGAGEHARACEPTQAPDSHVNW